jgi:hypothetical protein
MHADGEEQGSGLGSDIQNVADDSGLFDLNSHDNSLLFVFTRHIITPAAEKNKRKKRYLWCRTAHFSGNLWFFRGQ